MFEHSQPMNDQLDQREIRRDSGGRRNGSEVDAFVSACESGIAEERESAAHRSAIEHERCRIQTPLDVLRQGARPGAKLPRFER